MFIFKKITGKCNYKDCQENATLIALSRDNYQVNLFCETHANTIVDSDNPEYCVSCPNCDCRFGVN